MNWIVKLLVCVMCCTSMVRAEDVQYFGWVPVKKTEANLAKTNFYTEQLQSLVPFNDENDAYNYRFLFKALKDAKMLSSEEIESGRLNSLNQGSVGSCVGYGTTHALEVVAAANIFHRKQLREEWKARINPDAVYALGRHDHRGGWDGSTGDWSTDALKKYGSLHSLVYGQHDLTNTKPTDGRAWARSGVPSALLTAAGDHKALACALVKTTEEAKAALQNGYAIIICAQASYPSSRDSQGFSKLNGRRWAHCMAVSAYRGPQSGKEGFLIQNSWGNNWNNGPIYPEDMPHGSFWVTPSDLMVHLRQNDSYAIAGYEGFKLRKIQWEDVFNFNGELSE